MEIRFKLYLLAAISLVTTNSKQMMDKPNIVIMIADDLGYGDIGCFGNTTLRTPNIDKIAAEGVKLTHHLTAASVCTPSRAALMTGRYPVRMGLVSPHRIGMNLFTSSISGLPEREVTFAELAKTQGYSTALIGKWHLGVHSSDLERDFKHHPLNQGFDHYYGLPLTNMKDYGDDGERVILSARPMFTEANLSVGVGAMILFGFLYRQGYMSGRKASIICLLVLLCIYIVWWTWMNLKLLNSILMRNHEVVEQQIKLPGLTDRLVNEGTKFLEQRHQDNKPFLLVMSWIQVHTALHATRTKGKSAHGPYGDEVEELDWSVGQILDALQKLGFKDNTFVYFTSDNGAHIEETGVHGNREGGYNGPFRGGKFQGGMDGGIRVPTVAMWPGVIPPGSTIDLPSSLMDVYPTLAHVLGASVPQDRVIDGVNILPLLKGEKQKAPPHEFMLHYCGKYIHAARYMPDINGVDVWKAHFTTPNWNPGTEGCDFHCRCFGSIVTHHDPPLLYNIGRDPSEKTLCTPEKPCPPLTSAKQHNDIIDYITKATQEHVESVDTSVTNQYAWYRMLPRPWLQMCCNFPSCDCTEF